MAYLKKLPLLILLFITACATGPVATLSESIQPINQAYPAISIFRKNASEALDQDCKEFAEKSMLHHCSINGFDYREIRDKLRESEYFERVSYASDQSEYQLLITNASYDHEGAGELSNAVLSGASLLLIPLKTEILVKTEVAIHWNETFLKSYTFEIPVVHKTSLFSNSEQGKVNFANELVSQLLIKTQEDKIFEPEFIYSNFNASNYHDELIKPERIGDFKFKQQHLYRSPLLGTMLRYTHPNFNYNNIDVFVYPILKSDYTDTKLVLDTEVQNFLKDVDIATKEGVWKHMDFQPVEHIAWQSSAGLLNGRKMTGELENDKGQTYVSNMYIFTTKDKFIKIRSSFVNNQSTPNVETELSTILNDFTVPDESVFMAKLRQQSRQSQVD